MAGPRLARCFKVLGCLAAGCAVLQFGLLWGSRDGHAESPSPPPVPVVPPPAAAAEPAAPPAVWRDSYELRSGELRVSLRRDGDRLSWRAVRWGGEGAPCEDLLEPDELFVVRPHAPEGRPTPSRECALRGPPEENAAGTGLRAALDCPHNLSVEWSAALQELPSNLGTSLRVQVSLSGAAVAGLGVLLLRQRACSPLQPTGQVDGSPVRAGHGRFIFGMEHPLAKHYLAEWTNDMDLLTSQWLPASAHRLAAVAAVTHLEHLQQDGAAPRSLRYGAVVVAVREPATQGRRAFAAYLQAARPPGAWRGPLTHYNSWFDFYSWQDEGRFSDERTKRLRREPMCEDGALKRLAGFEALTRRGAQLDSFLWDDGWDDPAAGLWAFDKRKFPNEFRVVAEKARSMGAGMSVWLSPWGGYGQAKVERLKHGKKQGLEANSLGFSLAGPKYYSRFRQAVLEFRRKSHVNMFKFDGIAGSGSEVYAEIEAMLQIMLAIRQDANITGPPPRGSAEHSGESPSTGSRKGSDHDSFWINLTTGTWPSPFFLLWVDSVWRGSADTAVPNWAALKGLEKRQRWQVWRECVVFTSVVKRAELFPLAHVMLHGAVVAAHGDALEFGLDAYTPLSWAQEVWSFVAMGVQLQELYVSPKQMSPWAWDELAQALRWARDHSDVLQDARWAFPARCEDEHMMRGNPIPPYGVASWRERPSGLGTGFVLLRNPRDEPQAAPEFRLAEALELPARLTREAFVIEAVRRLVPGGDAGSINGTAALGLSCAEVVVGSEEFKVVVSRGAGQRLGLRSGREGSAGLEVQAVRSGGLVQQWNEDHPELAVKPGDLIVEVNGIRDDAKKLLDECAQNKTLELVVKRGQVPKVPPAEATELSPGRCRVAGDAVLRLSLHRAEVLLLRADLDSWGWQGDLGNFTEQERAIQARNERAFGKVSVKFLNECCDGVLLKWVPEPPGNPVDQGSWGINRTINPVTLPGHVFQVYRGDAVLKRWEMDPDMDGQVLTLTRADLQAAVG